LKGGYALELRFKAARSTVDIDLTLQRVEAATSADRDTNQVVREMLQNAADISLGDWFAYTVGQPVLDLTAVIYGGALTVYLPIRDSSHARTPEHGRNL